MANLADMEAGQAETSIDTHNLFETKLIRHNFIKKVYTLLSLQLLITTCAIALFALHDGVKGWALKNSWYSIVCMVAALVMIIVVSCSSNLRRKHPHNLILLFAFTIAEALMVTAITTLYDPITILMAGGLTLAIASALTLFAMQTRYDFTTKYGLMVVVLVVAMMGVLIASFFPQNNLVSIGIASVMAIIMGIFLVIDTQMIVGGTHSIKLSPEEYVFATITIYLDLINMFLYILRILGASSRS